MGDDIGDHAAWVYSSLAFADEESLRVYVL
jgi:hypothetical protein